VFCLFGLLLGSVTGCDCSKPQKDQLETLTFKVDHSLLEPEVTDAVLQIRMSAPKHWKPVDKTALEQVIVRLEKTLTQGIEMKPRWVFLNAQSQSMCVVSQLDSVDITQGKKLLTELETEYRARLPAATIEHTVFLKEEFRVHQIMMSNQQLVLIKLLIDAFGVPVFEIDYVVPQQVYTSQARAIESSIGSINPLASRL
jgi:hypothetical protein